ncbi:MAG TPA: transketolase [Candidatus Ventrousia excrementavium]|uniref:Transketolase n=1 Tax=Candidatus Ventrousia excrementavium TaxID=2840961 RepID=A0A9D1IUI2_9CLOT|nr:transketolase [Candidatus Ventrousia excrementavium]
MEKNKAVRVFAEEIRVETLKEFAALGFGHVGGSMSVIEALAVLYGKEMRIDPKNPQWPERDRLVMSKGHAGPALYATLALKGYFPLEVLKTLNQGGTILPSHCDRLKTPGVDMTTGSLGQGISLACGLAMGNRMQGRDSYTYLVLGDGECNEGQVWEGAMFAAHFKLNHLIAFVDLNKQQLDGTTDDVMSMGDMVAKFESFGWLTKKVNGHNVDEIIEAIAAGKAQTEKPVMIILDTIKGNGCELALQRFPNHHIAFTAEEMAPSIEKAEAVLARVKGE